MCPELCGLPQGHAPRMPFSNDVHDKGQGSVTSLFKPLHFQPLQPTLTLAVKGMCCRTCPPFLISTVSQYSSAQDRPGLSAGRSHSETVKPLTKLDGRQDVTCSSAKG